jgi:hypothetical protein
MLSRSSSSHARIDAAVGESNVLYTEFEMAGASSRCTGLKIEVFAISLLSIADQIVSVFPGKMRKIHNLAGSRAGTAERSPLLHKFLHDEFA